MIPHEELKKITRARRSSTFLKARKQEEARLDRVFELGLIGVPIPLADMPKIKDFVRHCFALGATDRQAAEAVRKFVDQLNGRSVQ